MPPIYIHFNFEPHRSKNVPSYLLTQQAYSPLDEALVERHFLGGQAIALFE